MAKPFDAILKQILDDYAADWVAWLAPQLGLPDGPVEPIDSDLSTVQPTADKVFRLPGTAGLLHLELQSTWGGSLPDRLLTYNTLLHDRHGGPVQSLAIHLRQDAEARALTSTLLRHWADGREYLRFHYGLVRVWQIPADQFLTGGVGLAPLALLSDDAEPQLPAVMQRLADRIREEIPNPDERDRLLVGSYILSGLRYDKAVTESLFRGIQDMEESSTYRGIIEKGMQKGLEQGRLEGHRLILITLLEQKFGSVPPQLAARIDDADTAKLQAAIRQILTITTLDELKL